MYILLINPFPSGAYLSESFKRLGLNTIALYTKNHDEIVLYMTPNPDWFNKQIFLNTNDPKVIVEAVKDYQITYVLNGLENSAHLTDQVAQILTPMLSNNPETSSFRMDKHLMHKCLAQSKLPHIQQIEFILNEDDIHNAKFKALDYPCFVKPLNGAGSQGISKINDYDQLVKFFENINKEKLSKDLDMFLEENAKLIYLICEFIEGDEYFVDTFSFKGKHYISSIQKYTKKLIANTKCYRSWEITTDPLILSKISNYIEKVLDSIELKNGFAHSEIFITPKQSPILIEVNHRISGARGFCNKMASYENLKTQPEILYHIISGETINNDLYSKLSPTSRTLTLFNFSTNPLPDFTKALKKYSTVKEIKQLRPINHIWETLPTSVVDIAALVICSSEDHELLTKEIEEILLQDEKGWTS